jgi:tripartite-type tricarboxylate transporter receptor subunit TctC
MARLLLVLLLVAGSAWAQGWPSRPEKLVVPFPPGGTTDVIGRLLAQRLAEQLNASIVVENRPGAGGTIGSEHVARSAPDGYTLLVSAVTSHVIYPLFNPAAPYDPLRDFTHIALLGGPPTVLAVNAELPAKDLAGLVALAKAGSLSYGSPGNGSQSQLVTELFMRGAGIAMHHVPYRGAAYAVTDLVAGHVPVVSTTISTLSSQIRGGRVRILAVTAPGRLADYPDIPTFAELGYPDIVATVWSSLSGPAGMPPEVVRLLNAEARRALEHADMRERLRQDGIAPNRLDASAFTAFVADELRRWAPVVRASGAKND